MRDTVDHSDQMSVVRSLPNKALRLMKLVLMRPVQDLVQLAAFLGVRKIREWFVDVDEPIESCKACTVSVSVNILL